MRDERPDIDPLPRIAARVRAARARADMPRRVLAEVSGVSARYLAQLESGTGNISITLLDRVARALNLSLEDLVRGTAPRDPEAEQVAQLFEHAPVEIRRQVLDLLAESAPDGARDRRICLIGLRGAGKSTLGRMAAAELEIPFVELTEEIEADTGMPLSEILALYGPEGYREIEARVLADVSRRPGPLILAVAGGIVGDDAAFRQILEQYRTIWLRATPEDHMERVRAQGDLRPMAGNPAAMEQLRGLLARRSSLYAQADAQLDTSGRTLEDASAALVRTITRGRE